MAGYNSTINIRNPCAPREQRRYTLLKKPAFQQIARWCIIHYRQSRFSTGHGKYDMKNKLNYRNITISGLPGAGSSTLGKALAKVLGWEYFSGGDFMRQYAIKKGLIDKNNRVHHDATVYNQDFDRQVDFKVRKTLKNQDKKIIESWISSFMAQGINGVLKVLLFCSDDSIRVDRIVNRDELTVENAKKHIFDRQEKNLKKWQSLYSQEWKNWVVEPGTISRDKPIWFWYPELFDLTIDTYRFSKEQTLKKVLKKMGATINKIDYHSIFSLQ